MAYITTRLTAPYIDEEALLRENSHIFHYTNLDSLREIALSRGLWARHYKQLNDATEFRIAAEAVSTRVFRDTSRSLRSSINLSSRLRKIALREFGSVKALLEEEAKVLPAAIMSLADQYMPTHVTSFAAHAKDHQKAGGILSLWRAYAGQNGVALRFDLSKLLEALLAIRDTQSFNAIYVAGVTYGPNDPRYCLQLEGLQSLASVYEKLTRSYMRGIAPESMPEGFNDASSRFLVTSITHKHAAFEDEREVRIVAAPLLVTEPEETRGGPNWVEQSADASVLLLECIEAVDAVMIGPTTDQASLGRAAQQSWCDAGLRRPAIIYSDIPYRPPQLRRPSS